MTISVNVRQAISAEEASRRDTKGLRDAFLVEGLFVDGRDQSDLQPSRSDDCWRGRPVGRRIVDRPRQGNRDRWISGTARSGGPQHRWSWRSQRGRREISAWIPGRALHRHGTRHSRLHQCGPRPTRAILSTKRARAPLVPNCFDNTGYGQEGQLGLGRTKPMPARSINMFILMSARAANFWSG